MFHMLEVSLPIITVLLDLAPSLISCNTVHSISLSDPDARFHPTDIVVLLLLGISVLLISLVETET